MAIKKAPIKEIADAMPEPKSAYNTIAKPLKVLNTKGFADFESVGTTYIHYPLIAETQYTRFAFDKTFKNYFNGSYKHLVSFLIVEKALNKETRRVTVADKIKGGIT